MTIRILTIGFVAALLSAALPLAAQIRVNPTGVNVNTQGATTVFLTYGGLRGQVAVEAFWCGSLISATPARGLRCNPGTIFGSLQIRYDQSRVSGTLLNDVMSIPASVSRRAYQDAARGNTSSFYYVRRFVSASGAPDEYVAVTCRLAGGGARVPFALTDVAVNFESRAPVLFVERDAIVSSLAADIAYNGTGRLRGRWEVVLPGDERPTADDLLTEATLPPETRGTQRRYTELQRFNVFLPPTGRVVLPGPDVTRLPTTAEGTYLILLRIEAADDKEADSDRSAAAGGPAGGIVHSGAVAGFPMPVLRYVVGSAGNESPVQVKDELMLLLPRDRAIVTRDSTLTVSWLDDRHAALYRVDFETDDGESVLNAVVSAGVPTYKAPPFLFERARGKSIRWRVTSIGVMGAELRHSRWRVLTMIASSGS